MYYNTATDQNEITAVTLLTLCQDMKEIWLNPIHKFAIGWSGWQIKDNDLLQHSKLYNFLCINKWTDFHHAAACNLKKGLWSKSTIQLYCFCIIIVQKCGKIFNSYFMISPVYQKQFNQLVQFTILTQKREDQSRFRIFKK